MSITNEQMSSIYENMLNGDKSALSKLQNVKVKTQIPKFMESYYRKKVNHARNINQNSKRVKDMDDDNHSDNGDVIEESSKDINSSQLIKKYATKNRKRQSYQIDEYEQISPEIYQKNQSNNHYLQDIKKQIKIINTKDQSSLDKIKGILSNGNGKRVVESTASYYNKDKIASQIQQIKTQINLNNNNDKKKKKLQIIQNVYRSHNSHNEVNKSNSGKDQFNGNDNGNIRKMEKDSTKYLLPKVSKKMDKSKVESNQQGTNLVKKQKDKEKTHMIKAQSTHLQPSKNIIPNDPNKQSKPIKPKSPLKPKEKIDFKAIMNNNRSMRQNFSKINDEQLKFQDQMMKIHLKNIDLINKTFQKHNLNSNHAYNRYLRKKKKLQENSPFHENTHNNVSIISSQYMTNNTANNQDPSLTKIKNKHSSKNMKDSQLTNSNKDLSLSKSAKITEEIKKCLQAERNKCSQFQQEICVLMTAYNKNFMTLKKLQKTRSELLFQRYLQRYGLEIQQQLQEEVDIVKPLMDGEQRYQKNMAMTREKKWGLHQRQEYQSQRTQSLSLSRQTQQSRFTQGTTQTGVTGLDQSGNKITVNQKLKKLMFS